MKSLFGTAIVAVVCEGPTEETILDILLGADMLRFRCSDLLGEKVLGRRYRDPKRFQEDYLKFDYEGRDVAIVMVHDRKCGFSINYPYREKISGVFWVLTKPESEMLMVHHFGFYDDYKKHYRTYKPSTYLAQKLKLKTSEIKSEEFLRKTFDAPGLERAIRQYERLRPKKRKGDYGLIDLLV